MKHFLGLGTDIIEISRIKKAIKNVRFLEKVYSLEELRLIGEKGNKAETYAGRFAAKEAISKAFGTGMRGITFSNIEIINDDLGKPIIKFKNNIKAYEEKYLVEVSISHCKEYAVSTAIVFTKENEVKE